MKMTIQDCINAALRLVNQYSITGTEVPLTYNDQADDVARMLDLINDAQMQIATSVKEITEHVEIVIGEEDSSSAEVIVDLENVDDRFIRPVSLTFTPLNGKSRRSVDASEYKWIGSELYLPAKHAGTYRVDYCRYPARYRTDILNLSYDERAELMLSELDNTPDTHEIIPYYVGAMISLDQNPKAYYALYNIWETRLSRLNMKTPHAVRTIVSDVYGFDEFRGVW